MPSDALELIGVTKAYEVGGAELIALENVDLNVASDEVVTLLGPSGSGKTTLLSIAGGLLSTTHGRVVVGGEDITRLSARRLTSFRRERVGFIFQAVNLVPFLTARENLLVVAELARRRRGEAKRRADRLLEELGLGSRLNNLPSQLSGGERQRVAIGRALMNAPELILVDEPTSALDSDLGQQVMELIVSEVKNRGAAAIVVTHDARMTRYGDRILNMADGRIVGGVSREEWTRNRPEPAAAEREPQAAPLRMPVTQRQAERRAAAAALAAPVPAAGTPGAAPEFGGRGARFGGGGGLRDVSQPELPAAPAVPAARADQPSGEWGADSTLSGDWPPSGLGAGGTAVEDPSLSGEWPPAGERSLSGEWPGPRDLGELPLRRLGRRRRADDRDADLAPTDRRPAPSPPPAEPGRDEPGWDPFADERARSYRQPAHGDEPEPAVASVSADDAGDLPPLWQPSPGAPPRRPAPDRPGGSFRHGGPLPGGAPPAEPEQWRPAVAPHIPGPAAGAAGPWPSGTWPIVPGGEGGSPPDWDSLSEGEPEPDTWMPEPAPPAQPPRPVAMTTPMQMPEQDAAPSIWPRPQRPVRPGMPLTGEVDAVPGLSTGEVAATPLPPRRRPPPGAPGARRTPPPGTGAPGGRRPPPGGTSRPGGPGRPGAGGPDDLGGPGGPGRPVGRRTPPRSGGPGGPGDLDAPGRSDGPGGAGARRRPPGGVGRSGGPGGPDDLDAPGRRTPPLDPGPRRPPADPRTTTGPYEPLLPARRPPTDTGPLPNVHQPLLPGVPGPPPSGQPGRSPRTTSSNPAIPPLVPGLPPTGGRHSRHDQPTGGHRPVAPPPPELPTRPAARRERPEDQGRSPGPFSQQFPIVDAPLVDHPAPDHPLGPRDFPSGGGGRGADRDDQAFDELFGKAKEKERDRGARRAKPAPGKPKKKQARRAPGSGRRERRLPPEGPELRTAPPDRPSLPPPETLRRGETVDGWPAELEWRPPARHDGEPRPEGDDGWWEDDR